MFLSLIFKLNTKVRSHCSKGDCFHNCFV